MFRFLFVNPVVTTVPFALNPPAWLLAIGKSGFNITLKVFCGFPWKITEVVLGVAGDVWQVSIMAGELDALDCSN